MLSRFDEIPACDGQTDEHTFCDSIIRAMHIEHRAVMNLMLMCSSKTVGVRVRRSSYTAAWNFEVRSTALSASNSPDLNPVDYRIWRVIQNRVYQQVALLSQRGRTMLRVCPFLSRVSILTCDIDIAKADRKPHTSFRMAPISMTLSDL